uniref:Germin n=1 Tax=Solanum tuberosum TaxID=4113 RepID=M1A8V4_SOLTU
MITMNMWWFITSLVITAFFCNSPVYAYDNNPLQDICVAVNDSQASVFVNGKICKDPKLATADDFFASGFNVSGNAVPVIGIAATFVDVNKMPGLNTLGLIHFQYNVGNKKATYLTFVNSQNPGLVMIPRSIFASEPPVPDDILAKGFQLDETQIAELRKKFS